MDISEIKWPAKRRRGRYSNEFKREVVKACQAPGVSTASVALANGINANLLRRWVAEWGDGRLRWDCPGSAWEMQALSRLYETTGALFFASILILSGRDIIMIAC
ncbi:MAG: hypothetical protein EBW71_08135 [Betaproteobacteria bacterium]|nr:hypothetical protein [Betaproteobacteria bacterium]